MNQQLITTEALHDKSNYDIASLDDEIRADRHCAALLKNFHQYLLTELKAEPLEAGALAAGADYFLREFIIGDRHENIFNVTAQRIRQFGGNWYIIRNLEPNMEELIDMVEGADAFYRYCAGMKLIAADTAEEISRQCARLDDFSQRIEDFHAISSDGFKAWDQGCPID